MIVPLSNKGAPSLMTNYIEEDQRPRGSYITEEPSWLRWKHLENTSTSISSTKVKLFDVTVFLYMVPHE